MAYMAQAMNLSEALDVAICGTQEAYTETECKYLVEQYDEAARILRAFRERGLPFLEAADAYCMEWKKDHRNTRDWAAVGDKLSRVRSGMYDAHFIWKETP